MQFKITNLFVFFGLEAQKNHRIGGFYLKRIISELINTDKQLEAFSSL